MNCPTCGSSTTPDQQFCRSCGTGLIGNEKRPFNPRFWNLLALALTFGGLMIAMTGKLIDLRWVIFAGVFVSMGGMFSIAALGVLRQTSPGRSKRTPIQQPNSLSPAETTKKLSPIGDLESVPSVTEATTNLLDENIPALAQKRVDLR